MDRRNVSLDGLNLFLADVRDGLGPYLAVYLLTERRWDEARIGLVMTLAGLAGIAAQAPAGMLIDQIRAKRGVIMGAAVVVALACLSLPWLQGFVAIVASQAAAAAAGAVFSPAIAAVTLGLVGAKAFARRTGRNEVFNHLGNAGAAAGAGGLALIAGPIGVFWLLGGMAVASLVAAAFLPANEIDADQARGLGRAGERTDGRLADWRALLRNRPLLIFTCCCALFHLANAAMLPLVGQKLALQDKKTGTALMSACIFGAQVVMVPMAALAGAKADGWGRKPLLLLAFAALPLRGVLYTLSDDRWWLLGVQTMDGIGAGLFGALFPVVIADLTRGTGRFNASLGAASALFGIGGALSTSVAGLVVVRAGYAAAFLTLAAIAMAGLALLAFAMPETRGIKEPAASRSRTGSSSPAA